jgi:fumarate reductase subunit C
VSAPHQYTLYHPRWYRTRVSTYWWLGRWPYLLFILRELSSVSIAWFVVYLLFLVDATGRDEAAYLQFLEWSRRPGVLVMNVVSLLFVVLHAITWFNLAPQAMVVRVAGRRMPGPLVAAANYAAWAIVTAAVLAIVLGRG